MAIYYDLTIFENQENLKNLWDATWNEKLERLFFLIIFILQQDIIINDFFNDQGIVKNHWYNLKFKQILEEALPTDHPYLGIMYNNLVNLFINQG